MAEPVVLRRFFAPLEYWLNAAPVRLATTGSAIKKDALEGVSFLWRNRWDLNSISDFI